MFLRGQGQYHGSSRLRPKPLAFTAKAKAMGLQGQSRPLAFKAKAKAVGLRDKGEGHGPSRPKPRPWFVEAKAMAKAVGLRGQAEGHGPSRSRPMPWVFEAKAKATGFHSQGQAHGSLRSRPRPLAFNATGPLAFKAKAKVFEPRKRLLNFIQGQGQGHDFLSSSCSRGRGQLKDPIPNVEQLASW